MCHVGNRHARHEPHPSLHLLARPADTFKVGVMNGRLAGLKFLVAGVVSFASLAVVVVLGGWRAVGAGLPVIAAQIIFILPRRRALLLAEAFARIAIRPEALDAILKRARFVRAAAIIGCVRCWNEEDEESSEHCTCTRMLKDALTTFLLYTSYAADEV